MKYEAKKEVEEVRKQQQPDGDFQSSKDTGDTLNEAALGKQDIPDVEPKEPRSTNKGPGATTNKQGV